MNRSAFSHVASAIAAIAVISPVAVLFRLSAGAELDLSGQAWTLAVNTLALTGLTMLGAVAIGVPLALVTAAGTGRSRRLWLALLVAPLAIPSYVGAFAYFAAFGSGGEIEMLTGLPTGPVRGLFGTALVMTLYTYPFVLLTTWSSLSQLDGRVVEAARALGAGPREVFLRVILPRVRGGIAAGTLLVGLYAMSDFATPAILGLDTYTRSIYVEYNAFGLDRAALLSLQLLVLVGLLLILETRFKVEQEPVRTRHAYRIGRAAGVSLGLLGAAVLAAAVALPALVLLVWLWRDGGGGFDPMLAWQSAYPAVLAAIAATLVALPVAHAATLSRHGRWLERLATLGFGIPGIVMGTALLYVGLRIDALYQTVALLVAGYVLRFLPLAVAPLRNSLARLDRNLVAASRSLGAGPIETFRRISLPLILPGAVAGGALVFLEVMRELPITLLLRPTGLETLTTELWQVYEAGYFGRAALPGLLLILVSSVAVVFTLKGDGRARSAPGA